MKAILRENGELVVSGETGAEQYALRNWNENWCKRSGDIMASLFIDWGEGEKRFHLDSDSPNNVEFDDDTWTH